MRAFRQRLKTFTRERSGSMATLFALAAIPTLGMVGAAVDYSRSSYVKAALQQAVDAAVLSAVRAEGKSDSEKGQIANDVFRSNVKAYPQLQNVTYKLTAEEGGVYRYAANANVRSAFLKLAGIESTLVSAKAAAGLTYPGLANGMELVLLFDTTGSMTLPGCWCDAISAVKSMVDSLKGGCGHMEQDLTVSLIPFSDRVNIGTGNASWLSVNPTPADWQGCVEPREENISGNPYTLTAARPAPGKFKPTAAGHAISNIGNSSGQPLPYCPNQSIVGPTKDSNIISQAIGNMKPGGTGRYDEAIAWGWRMLSPTWRGMWGGGGYPASAGERRKVLVFLTDGYTTGYDYEVGGAAGGSFGFNNGSAAGFKNFVDTCTRAKSEGIEIHVVHTNGSNPHFDSYGRSCATGPDYYHSVNDTIALGNVLKKIETTTSGKMVRLVH